jgi:hypothetical protein
MTFVGPKWSRSRKKAKARVNFQRKRCAWGKYVRGCRGHPGIVIETWFSDADIHGNSVDIRSLVDGEEESCSLLHCSPTPMTKERAEAEAAYWRLYGKEAAWLKFQPDWLAYLTQQWEEQQGDPDRAEWYRKPIHEYLHLTEEQYDLWVVRGELP